jgi:hypothetical protein
MLTTLATHGGDLGNTTLATRSPTESEALIMSLLGTIAWSIAMSLVSPACSVKLSRVLEQCD